MHRDSSCCRLGFLPVLVPRAIGAAHPRAALALLVVRELSPVCTRGRREADCCAASPGACDVVRPRWRCLTLLSLNVLGRASNGMAVLNTRRFAARLLRCLGCAGHGSLLHGRRPRWRPRECAFCVEFCPGHQVAAPRGQRTCRGREMDNQAYESRATVRCNCTRATRATNARLANPAAARLVPCRAGA